MPWAPLAQAPLGSRRPAVRVQRRLPLGRRIDPKTAPRVRLTESQTRRKTSAISSLAYEADLLCLTARSGTSSRASERLTSRTSRATSSGCRRVMKCSASITRTSSRCSSAYLRPASDNMLSPSPMSALVGVVSQALFRLSPTRCANPTQRIGMPSFVSAWSTRASVSQRGKDHKKLGRRTA
jgi:hypothetical protein